MTRSLPRRQFLTAAAGLSLLPSLGRIALAQADADPELAGLDFVTPDTQAAIDRGLAFLAARQNEDGSFGTGTYGRNVGICSLAGLAFMADGSTPGRGPYGEAVNKCLDFIRGNVQDSGFINVTNASTHGPMYGHGFATLFLAEAYGMTPDSTIREKLVKAVKLILTTQNSDGGWRYRPVPREADISVTICQVMALRAARNGGIYVPNDVIDRCTQYVKRCQNPDGGFMYTLEGGQSMFPRSAAGVVALYSAGVYEGEELEKGLEYLMQHIPGKGAITRDSHFFYGHYYAVQAMWHAGGEYWRQWYPAIRDVLVKEQNRNDGSWQDSISPEYGSAMACLILQMPNNYLPIFQR